jgi:hypothetical protein
MAVVAAIIIAANTSSFLVVLIFTEFDGKGNQKHGESQREKRADSLKNQKTFLYNKVYEKVLRTFAPQS